ncbi:MAG: DPP IV N-terminal domain-containing protein [Chitinivibrionales bacterium]
MRISSFAPLLVLLCMHLSFADKVDLEAYASGFDSIPVAVLDFRSQNDATISENKPWEVIAADLAFSGRFKVTRVEKVDSAVFAENNIGLFIDGEYTIEGDNITIDCYLHDATTMDLLVGKKYRGKTQYQRNMAHRYANEIYEILLAERGVFETKILYVVDQSSQKNIGIMDYDGHNGKNLTNSSSVNIFPAFMDTNTIVWTGFFRGKPDLYKGSISTGKFDIFVYSRFVETSPSISTITDRVAYASSRQGNMDIYTCDTDGADRKRLTFNRAIDTSPTWSPNGYQIAFTSDRSGQPQIYIMDSEGANTKRITFDGSYQDSPAWSPKADKIAYSSLHNGKFDIWIVDPDGANARAVTSMPGNNEYPSWSPDGAHIAFVNTRGRASNIYAVNVTRGEVKQLTFSGNAKMPDWSQF